MAIARAGTAVLRPMHAFAFCSPKVDHSLAVEAQQPDNSAQAYAVHEIERNDFVLSDAAELAVRPEAQAPRLPESDPAIRSEDTNETTIGSIIFADSCHRIRSSKRMLAADDHVAVWRDCEVERAELRILDLPGRLDPPFRTERQNGILAFAARTDAGRQKECAVLAKCKPARKRDHRGRKHNLARGHAIERAG